MPARQMDIVGLLYCASVWKPLAVRARRSQNRNPLELYADPDLYQVFTMPNIRSWAFYTILYMLIH